MKWKLLYHPRLQIIMPALQRWNSDESSVEIRRPRYDPTSSSSSEMGSTETLHWNCSKLLKVVRLMFFTNWCAQRDYQFHDMFNTPERASIEEFRWRRDVWWWQWVALWFWPCNSGFDVGKTSMFANWWDERWTEIRVCKNWVLQNASGKCSTEPLLPMPVRCSNWNTSENCNGVLESL